MSMLDLFIPGQEESPHKLPPIKGLICGGIAILVVIIVIGILVSCLAATNEANKALTEELRLVQQQLEDALKIDVSYVGNKLETISELATAEMTYNGIIHFTDGDIPFINKKEFYMSYRVSLKAGFDLSQADIKVTEHTVTINLPEAEIYEPTVDETSLQFFDQSTSLFNQETKEDLIEAISAAKEDVLAQPETENMRETAKKHVIILITALFEGQIGDRDLIINIG